MPMLPAAFARFPSHPQPCTTANYQFLLTCMSTSLPRALLGKPRYKIMTYDRKQKLQNVCDREEKLAEINDNQNESNKHTLAHTHKHGSD